MTLPDTLEMVEVGPRDGLQNESAILPTTAKLALIEKALAAGVKRIEVASFVHPKRVPQMADAEAVCEGLSAKEGVIYIGLALNERGLQRALATGVHEIGAVAAASESFARRNQGRSVDETVEDAMAIIKGAKAAGRRGQATISVAFGCPYDGVTDPARVIDVARRLAAADPHEIAIGDTIGVATPDRVIDLMQKLKRAIPGIPLRMHFHDTRNMAIANVWGAIGAGAAVVDASIGGTGGCPFAKGASGNVATEDVLYMLDNARIRTGLRIEDIIETSRWLGGRLGKELPAKLSHVPAFPGGNDTYTDGAVGEGK